MLRLALPLALFLALAGLLWSGIGKDTRLIPSPLIDKPAPEFRSARIAGGQRAD